MDESFLLRARQMMRDRPRPVGHADLIDSVRAAQAASPTARAQARLVRQDGDDLPAALEIVLEDAPAGVSRRSGCFNRAVAVRLGNER